MNGAAGVGEILGLAMMRRLLDANDFEEELKHYKSVTTDAKRILPSSVVKLLNVKNITHFLILKDEKIEIGCLSTLKDEEEVKVLKRYFKKQQ
ncbi:MULTISPECIES: hypothetical protein [unclassified Bartonella]|uniref:hypothetical protein n=1 Tax=unclassified Bartonella TaxID=2645622 RepID=UPI0035D0418F